MITRFDSIKKHKVFQDFRWTAALGNFARVNLIYGGNATGKTTYEHKYIRLLYAGLHHLKRCPVFQVSESRKIARGLETDIFTHGRGDNDICRYLEHGSLEAQQGAAPSCLGLFN